MTPSEALAARLDALADVAKEVADYLRSDLEVQAEPEAPSESGRPAVTTLLTTRDLAAYLGIHPRTLQRWRHLRRVPKPLKLKGRPRWRQADVDRFLQERAP